MLALNWEAFYLGWAAVATSALAGITLWLVLWARRTFGLTEEIERKKRKPHMALWLVPPDTPQRYTAFVHAEQFLTYLKWQGIIKQRGLEELIRGPVWLACLAYNIGEGPAVRIRIPYRLQVCDVLEDGSAAVADEVAGEFEVVHVPAAGWNLSRTYLDVTYYPRWEIELLVDEASVASLEESEVAGAMSDTSDPKKTGDNKFLWDQARSLKEFESWLATTRRSPRWMHPGAATEDGGEG